MTTTAQYVGKVTPQIYIGLGGGGARMVSRLYDHFHDNPWWRKVRDESTAFVVVDTNKGDLDKLASREDMTTILLRSHGDWASEYGRSDPFLDHFLGNMLPRSTVEGAGQIRREARTKLYFSEQIVVSAIESALDKVLDDGNDFLSFETMKMEVLVFGTLGGGTCSGSFLPLAYLLRDIIAKRGWTPNLRGHFVHAEGVTKRVGELEPYVLANSYAAVKELEYLTAAQYRGEKVPFAYRRNRGAGDPIPEVDVAPYDWLCLADRPARALAPGQSVDDALADAAYVNLVTPAGVQAAGAHDNYTRFQVQLQKRIHEASVAAVADENYTAHWGTQGAAALRFPARDFKRYCADRWVSTQLRSQFGAGAVSLGTLDRTLFSEEELRTVLARQWAEELEAHAAEDWNRIVQGRKASGFEAPDLPTGAAGTVQKVSGRLIGREDVTTQRTAEFSGIAALLQQPTTEQAGAGKEPVIETVVTELIRNRARSVTDSVRKQGTIVAHQVPSAWNQLVKLDGDYDHVLARNNEVRKALRRKMEQGEWLEQLQVLLGAENTLDATALRYLVTRLRIGNPGVRMSDGSAWAGTDSAISELKLRINSLYSRTFATTADEMSQAARTPFDRAAEGVREEAQVGFFSRSFRALTGETGFDALGASHALERTVQQWVQDTNTYEALQTELALLEGMQLFLDRRLKHYRTLGGACMRIATKLDDDAAGRMRGSTRLETAFAIGSEVLDPIGAASTADRLWSQAYEDMLARPVNDAIGTDKVSAILNEVVAEEEEAGFVAHRTASKVVKRLRTLAEHVLQEMIFGTKDGDGLSLDRVLLLEAFYAQMDIETLQRTRPAAKAGGGALATTLHELRGELQTRAQRLTELRSAFSDPSDPKHSETRKRIELYIKKRLTAVAALAGTLAHVTGDGVANPDHRQMLVVIDDKVDQAIKSLFGDRFSWTTILPGKTKAEADDGEGLQQWDDQHIIFFYRIHGVLPIYRFASIDDAYHKYDNFMRGGGQYAKPHPLHIDARWEETLPEVSAQHYKDRSTKASGDLELLAVAMKCGVVFRINNRSHWRVEALNREDKLGGDDGGIFDAFSAWLNKAQARRGALITALERVRVDTDRSATASRRLEAVAMEGGAAAAIALSLLELIQSSSQR